MKPDRRRMMAQNYVLQCQKQNREQLKERLHTREATQEPEGTLAKTGECENGTMGKMIRKMRREPLKEGPLIGEGITRENPLQSGAIYIQIIYFMDAAMDEETPKAIEQQDPRPDSEAVQNSDHKDSEPKQDPEVKVPRRPGRPPLRNKPQAKPSGRAVVPSAQKDEQEEQERMRNRQRAMALREENNLEGFIKIVDYLKKIECDETSLHNKMNPYNLMTPTCFWFTVSAEYFSFDFFGSRNTHDLALDFLKRAQKTQITLPLRVIKPLRAETELEFESQALIEAARPVTDKLVSLIPLPLQTLPENVQKSPHITAIAEDDLFRSSTRAIVFNYIKNKISSNEKWAAALQPRLEAVNTVSPKQMASRIMRLQEEFKHEHLDVAPQLYYRQLNKKKKQGDKQGEKKKKSKKSKRKDKKKKAKKAEDEIYNESESGDRAKDEDEEDRAKEEDEDEKAKEDDQFHEDEEQVEHMDQQKQPSIQQEAPAEQQQDGDGDNIAQSEMKDCNEEINHQNIGENEMDVEQEQEQKGDEIIEFEKVYDYDDLLLDSVMHMPIDYVISILQSSITPPQLPEIERQFLPFPKSDPLELVYQIHPEEEKFLQYMKERQEKMYLDKTSHNEDLIEEKEREVQVEDAKCQVCTDGDYTDDNLIVFCSMCNISLHQRCVGLTKVPSDNWVCEVCAAFGPSGINVPCPLCNVKGGALKRTSIHISNPIFRDTNPKFHQFAKKCPAFKHKEQYIHKKITADDEPFYDYFTKSTYPTDEPQCHYVWVHYVCAIWVPECYFEEKNATINIKGVENIDKKRFKQKCLICNEFKGGACVKCDNEKCTKFYHPECARKKRVYMEQLNLDKLRYLIFCEAHEPLKMKRKMEVKKKKNRDEIVKFCRGIEKYVETYKIATLNFKLAKIGASQNVVEHLKGQKKEKGSIPDKVIIKIDRNSDEDFIRSVIEGLTKQNQIMVKITKISQGRYKVDEVVKPSKRDMRKSLTRVDQFWKNFNNGQAAENNLRRYNNIMRENYVLKQKIENFINYGSCTEGQSKEERKGKKTGRKREKETIIDEEGGIFCVCRRPYQGETDMFECDVCNQWYHHECIGFIGSEDDAQNLVFHCMKCLKFQSPEVKKALLESCSKFFSEDSLYLNYRPPTPSLQSEESVHHSSVSRQEIQANDISPQPRQQSHRGENSDHVAAKMSMNPPFIIEGPISRTNLPHNPEHQMEEQRNKPDSIQKRQEDHRMDEEPPAKATNIQNELVNPEQPRMPSGCNNSIEKFVTEEDDQAPLSQSKKASEMEEMMMNPRINSEVNESGNNETPFFKHSEILQKDSIKVPLSFSQSEQLQPSGAHDENSLLNRPQKPKTGMDSPEDDHI